MTVAPTVLIVEDSKFFAAMLQRRIEDELGFPVEWKATYAEAAETLGCCGQDYLAALLDLTLPDAPDGEIVPLALEKGIPSIVFTGGVDSVKRDRFLDWNLVDYVLKDSPGSVDGLLQTLERLSKNRDVKTLVVDDSPTMRDALRQLLSSRLFQVFEAADGQEALEVLGDNPDVRLVITDYDMPRMDGFELIRALRQNHSKNELAIIGMSASDEPLLSARLIKTGANDFVPKPFQPEEFHCRVDHAVEMLENIALIRRLSYTDSLTDLSNRRCFFERAPAFISQAETDGLACSVAMLDIDHFKAVNDAYGHDGGDEVLKTVSALLAKGFSQDALVARFGGEEFCVLLGHGPNADVAATLDGFRRTVESSATTVGEETVSVTVSVGAVRLADDLEAAISRADARLYAAKTSGRNRVVDKD